MRSSPTPSVAPLIAGGELKEYGCHMTAEGGRAMLGRIHTDGLVVIGDAAGLTLNTGFAIRGMDLAAGSALAAARAIDAALQADDVSAAGLARYPQELASSFVGHDLDTYANAPKLFEEDAMYRTVGPLAQDLFYRIYRHDGTPHQHAAKLAAQAWQNSDLTATEAARIAAKGVAAL